MTTYPNIFWIIWLKLDACSIQNIFIILILQHFLQQNNHQTFIGKTQTPTRDCTSSTGGEHVFVLTFGVKLKQLHRGGAKNIKLCWVWGAPLRGSTMMTPFLTSVTLDFMMTTWREHLIKFTSTEKYLVYHINSGFKYYFYGEIVLWYSQVQIKSKDFSSPSSQVFVQLLSIVQCNIIPNQAF